MKCTSGVVHPPSLPQHVLRWCQRLLFLIAVGGIGYAGFTLGEARIFQDSALHEIALHAENGSAESPLPVNTISDGGVIGRLDIARLGISVAILEGTSSKVLRLGVGHVEGTPLPGELGNSALAAHRDTFFRALKDARVGDLLDLQSGQGRLHYKVDWVQIVEPGDMSVLRPTPAASTLTLVTCYPFYYVGPAPKRFVVHAVRTP